MTLKKLIDYFSWCGVGAILIAYALSSFGIMEPTHFVYLSLNLFGGIFVAWDAFLDKNYQPVFLNIVWAVVAVVGIVRFFIYT